LDAWSLSGQAKQAAFYGLTLPMNKSEKGSNRLLKNTDFRKPVAAAA